MTTVTLGSGGEAVVYTRDDFGRVVRIADANGKFIEKNYGPGRGWMFSGVSRLSGEVITVSKRVRSGFAAS